MYICIRNVHSSISILCNVHVCKDGLYSHIHTVYYYYLIYIYILLYFFYTRISNLCIYVRCTYVFTYIFLQNYAYISQYIYIYIYSM